MKSVLKRIIILISYIKGLLVAVCVTLAPKKCLKREGETPLVIASVTSYGRRAEKTLPFAVRSILFQQRQPDRIVIWLDSDHYSPDNVPPVIMKLVRRYGVEVMFSADYKSFKKLIPSIQAFPDDIIITFDDDHVYLRDTVKRLLDGYESNPKCVYTMSGHIPTVHDNHIDRYVDWQQDKLEGNYPLLFPLGGTGTLYPPHSLDPLVTDSNLFQRLCPTADDVWFWVMALKNGTTHRLVGGQKKHFLPIDLLYQSTHIGARLMDNNLARNGNDGQISLVLSFFPEVKNIIISKVSNNAI